MQKGKEKELIEYISSLIEGLSQNEKRELFSKILSEETVPVSIFASKLSGLEALVVYLKDHQKKKVKDIAKLLNRKIPTIYATYSKSKKKKSSLKTTSKINIPISIFRERKISVLEHLVTYLKTKHNLSLISISTLLNKHPSTIKTTYWRYTKKCQ